jgi:heme/copper-type cytochrome/quinol oxidase subunit 4
MNSRSRIVASIIIGIILTIIAFYVSTHTSISKAIIWISYIIILSVVLLAPQAYSSSKYEKRGRDSSE